MRSSRRDTRSNKSPFEDDREGGEALFRREKNILQKGEAWVEV